MMRALPRFTVISACDSEEGRKATIAAAKLGSPVYMRWGREKSPMMTTAETPFEIGKLNILWQPITTYDVVIFATGSLVYNALLAARELEKEGVGVVVANVHTIKPLDEDKVLELARECGAVVTVEEHQVHGGLGGAIAELLAAKLPTPMEFVGMHDTFGQSGEAKELIEHYGMGAKDIIKAARKVTARK
jgi:transketolase